MIATWPSGTGPLGAVALVSLPKREVRMISPGAIALVATSAAVAPSTALSAPAGTPRLTTVWAAISFCAKASRAVVPGHGRLGDEDLLRGLPGHRPRVGVLGVETTPAAPSSATSSAARWP